MITVGIFTLIGICVGYVLSETSHSRAARLAAERDESRYGKLYTLPVSDGGNYPTPPPKESA